MPKSICIIAARGGSKGVPKKNTRNLGGQPLISYAIKSALKSKIFSSVVVSTEDPHIASVAKKYGADVPFLRPKRLATDTAGMDDVLLHAVNELRLLGYDFDVLVNRDCTVPFIRVQDIRGSVSLLQRTKCDMVLGVYRQHHNPYFNMMETNQKGYLNFSKKARKKSTTRQNAPIVYQVNGLFVINVERFLQFRKIYMPKILPYEIPPETGLMIDTEFEFRLADCVASKMNI